MEVLGLLSMETYVRFIRIYFLIVPRLFTPLQFLSNFAWEALSNFEKIRMRKLDNIS